MPPSIFSAPSTQARTRRWPGTASASRSARAATCERPPTHGASRSASTLLNPRFKRCLPPLTLPRSDGKTCTISGLSGRPRLIPVYMDKLIERENAARSPLIATPALAVQFFLIPMAVIAVTVTVYLGFRSMLADERSAQEYLTEIQRGGSDRRWPAAYEL